MVSYTLPHLALQVPERYLNEYGNLMNDKPYTGQAGYLPCRWPHATYAAMVSALDDAIGRILKTLKENGIDSSTCVMFTSDNGATFNIGGADPGFFRSNGDLRGGKGSLYEGGIRVPLIIRWPGHTGNGIATDIPLAFWDIMPTMAELSGARQKTGTDGISFASLLAGKELKKEHEFLYWEFPGSGGSFAVRSGNWKLIRKDITRDQSSKIELYDLKADPGEKFNVASAHPDILNRLKQYSRKRSPAGKAEWNFIL
jgi:arylsulfatase